MILHLGVTDLPYANDGLAVGPKPKKVASGTQTTGDVAGWLEDKYHVMGNFFELHGEEVAGDLEESLAGAMENLLTGAPAASNPFGDATDEIENRFRKFLDDAEMEHLGYPGVPTKAALKGVRHRFKRPYRKREPRPSFIDTGLYQSSFKAWMG